MNLTSTAALTTLAALVTACHHDAAAPVTPIAAKPVAPPPAEEHAAPPPVVDDQKVSPGLAIGRDIAALCGIKPVASPNPTFAYDKDELTAEDRDVLAQLATCMTSGALKGKTVALIGRADPRGTEEYNLSLGSKRAASVGAYLGRLGVGGPQLAVTTRGALDATGTDEAGYQQDRRVDVQLPTGG